MKDLLINACILSERNTGLGIYTYQMIKYLCPILDKNQITYEILCKSSSYVPSEFADKTKTIQFNNFITRNISMERAYQDDYKLVWSTTQHGALFSKCNQIITIHDITPLIYPKGRRHQEFYYKFIIPRLIKNSVGIVTVSDSTKNDITKKYKNYIENPQKIKVIHNALDLKEQKKCEFTEITKKYNVKKQGYLCIIGIHYRYKNIHSVVQAYLKYKDLHSLKVIIIGNDKNNYGKYLHQLCEENNLNNLFIFTGYISDMEKNAILSNAFACLYPSLYEGFGFPLLEAMNVGVPVISSNASSLPEVGGDAAMYFDPLNIDKIHKAILDLMKNESLRVSYISKGFENLKRFNWNVTATEMFKYLYNFIQ